MKKVVICILVASLCGCSLINRTSSLDGSASSEDQGSEVEIINENSSLEETKKSEFINYNIGYSEWLKATLKDEYIITLIGASYCSHCIGFKPILESVAVRYNIPLYFYYINEMNDVDYNLIMSEYQTNYEGKVPHMFITKNGKVITNRTASMNEDDLIEFLKLNMIIE